MLALRSQNAQSLQLDLRAVRALDMLDDWSERLQGHQTQKREHVRRSFRTRVTVYAQEVARVAGECAESEAFTVWTRNISRGGLAFIYPGQLKLQRVIVCLDPQTGGNLWYSGEIVRQRQVHEGFWEYGMKFSERATM